MIEIKVTGFKDQTIEFEQPSQALLFLTELRQEHKDYLRPFIQDLEKPNWFNTPAHQTSLDCEPKRHPFIPFENGRSYTKGHPNTLSTIYSDKLREITAKYPLKVQITEFEDMNDLI